MRNHLHVRSLALALALPGVFAPLQPATPPASDRADTSAISVELPVASAASGAPLAELVFLECLDRRGAAAYLLADDRSGGT
jgi:hypothetical protein